MTLSSRRTIATSRCHARGDGLYCGRAMPQINEHFLNLRAAYLFAEIRRRTQAFVDALMDPVYPVYADSNVVAGRSGPADASGRYAGMVYLPCVAEYAFQPALPDRHVDLIYLCSPNNPTGAVASREALARWVLYARANA